MKPPTRFIVVTLIAAGTAPVVTPTPAPARAATERVDEAKPNDNRVPAGRLANGVLTIQLEAREVIWYPEEKPGAALPVYAFAEAGQPAHIPGPLIRVPAGTEIHVTVHNALPKPLRLRGLQNRASGVLDSTDLAPGASQELRFRVDIPGTYYYWGRTEPVPARGTGAGRDAELVGAFIIDPAGIQSTKAERVLVITVWTDTLAALGVKSEQADNVLRRETIPRVRWFMLAVNGRSWPYTERLSYTVGDTIHWRVINATPAPHPMHLHGFYYDIEARGDAQRDTIYTTGQQRKVVTEPLTGGTTMAMTWVPTRPGNWLFHCHLVTHIDEALRLSEHHAHDSNARVNHAEQGMAGLVVGIRVAPAKGVALAGNPAPRRRLRVFINERANVYGDQPGLSYILQEGPTPPALDSIRIPSSTIILHQHEPTEVTVINRAKQMATIHWHGIEIESFYDGVGDWSGWGTRVAPPIAPGDSFVVRLTPDRAGTFIYHTHTSEATQLVSGLYGTLLVLPENAPRDTTERVFLMGIGGPLEDARPTVNGVANPPPIELRAGVAHRFRFINISPLELRTVQLMGDSAMQQWRPVAKDGADLPPQQAIMRPGAVLVEPGETFDFEVMRQRPESLTLQITSPETIATRVAARARGVARDAIPRIVIRIPVVVQ